MYVYYIYNMHLDISKNMKFIHFVSMISCFILIAFYLCAIFTVFMSRIPNIRHVDFQNIRILLKSTLKKLIMCNNNQMFRLKMALLGKVMRSFMTEERKLGHKKRGHTAKHNIQKVYLQVGWFVFLRPKTSCIFVHRKGLEKYGKAKYMSLNQQVEVQERSCH